MKPNPLKALEKAIGIAGSQAELARLLSTPSRPIKQQHVWNWLRRDKKIPAEMALPIEYKTGVSRHETRADLYPHDRA